MLKRPGSVVVAVSIVLLLYCIMIALNLALPLVYFIFSISPFLLCWLAYSIIRFGKFTGKEFTDQQEWGYQDRQE